MAHRNDNPSCPRNVDPRNGCCDCDLGDQRQRANDRVELLRKVGKAKIEVQKWEKERRLQRRNLGHVPKATQAQYEQALYVLGELIASDPSPTAFHNLSPERAQYEKPDAVSARALTHYARASAAGASDLVRVNIQLSLRSVRLLAGAALARAIDPPEDMEEATVVELKALANTLRDCKPGLDVINDFIL